MSIGNTRSEGNKGINFPWQLKMLLGQECACDQLKQISSNTDQVEFLLSSILTTLQAETEYEAKFVKETCPGPPVTERILLEVRVWDQDTSTWVGTPTYYLPGDPTPTTIGAGCTIEYTDPSAVLGLILGAIQTGNLILQDIDDNTVNLETQLSDILTAYGAGQKACANSFSVTLCTEQGTTLSNILTELQGTLDVNITNATLAVTQSGAWTVTANQGTNPWVVSGTVALDATTLAALETITVLQGGSWTVALDATTLAALESVTIQNGPGAAAVNIQDGGNSITVDDGGGSITVDGAVTVSATDLDIRDLDCATDSVAICSDGTPVGAANPLPVNATFPSSLAVTQDPSSNPWVVSGTVDIGTIPEVEIKNDSGNPIPVSDGGGSLTVDGTIALDAGTLSALENITVQNGAGAAAVNIQDGGNSITVDGTVNVGNFPATQNVAVTSIVEVEVKNDTGNPLPVSGTVTVNQPVAVTDNGGSLTVDGTVNVGNFPASIEISNDVGNPVPVSGTVTITDGSGPVTVDGTVTANQGTSPWIVDTTATTRTPGLIRATGAGTIAAGARSISVYNAGSAAGDILGGTNNILAGEIFNFSAGGENDTLSAFAYDGTGTTLVITTIV